MSRIKEWWQSISRKWRLVIISLSAIVILGVGGVYGSLAYFAANPSACGTCHLMDTYVESYYGSDFMDNIHAEAEDQVKCKDCHVVTLGQITSEGIAFLAGDYELPLETTFYDQEYCLACHSFDDVQEATKDDWQDRGLHQIPPRKPPGSEADSLVLSSHPLETVDYIECQFCHRAHEESWGMSYCFGCHHAPGPPAECFPCHTVDSVIGPGGE